MHVQVYQTAPGGILGVITGQIWKNFHWEFFHVGASSFWVFLSEGKPLQPASLCCALGHLEGVGECNCRATLSTKSSLITSPKSGFQTSVPNKTKSHWHCCLFLCETLSHHFLLAHFKALHLSICLWNSLIGEEDHWVSDTPLFCLPFMMYVWALLNYLPKRRLSSSLVQCLESLVITT